MRHCFFSPQRRRVTFDNLYLDKTTGELAPLPSMVKAEFQRECDINNIIKAFSTTGMLTHVSARASQGMFTDLPDDTDFQSAIAVIERAREAFMALPSKIRERFGQDPERFLAFTSDPANLPEMRTLGIANPEPPAPPPPAPPPGGQIASPGTPVGGAGGTPPAGGSAATVAS